MHLEAKENTKSDDRLSSKKLRQIHQLWAATMVCGALIVTPQIAKADTTTLSGSQTTPQSVTTDPDPVVIVNTTDDFSVDTAAGNAVEIQGWGSLTYDDSTNNSSLVATNGFALSVSSLGDNAGTPGSINITTGGNLSGSVSGVYATNSGTGAITVTTTGTVMGNGDAISVAQSPGGTGDMTISAATATGGVSGINASNSGTGNTIITATGPVTGTNVYGIIAAHFGADVSVEAVDVTGGLYGILVDNYGTGSTDVTSTGTVTSTNGDGITVNVNTGIVVNDSDLTVRAATVTGNGTGIILRNDGTGNTNIFATGTVTGTNANGIDVTHSGTDVTINAVEVTGGQVGIKAVNNGSGFTDITTTGTVTGLTGDAINVNIGNLNASGVKVSVTDVDGFANGISVFNQSSGITEITATGTVTANSNGISVNNLSAANTGGVAVSVAAVEAGSNGIYVQNMGTGRTSVTATDTVTGTNGHGISVTHIGADLTVETAAVTGGQYGLAISNHGTSLTSITATGTVTGGSSDGISASNTSASNSGGMVISVAGVEGNINGINVNTQGTGNTNITATGPVTGTTSAGINVLHSANDLTIDAVDVTGGGTGISVSNIGTGLTDISTTGTVTGLAGDGVNVTHSPSNSSGLTVSVEDVTGSTNGVSVNNFGSGNAGIIATGTVEGTNGHGIAVSHMGADLTVEAATVTGGQYGISVTNSGTGLTSVTATGTVTGNNADGIIVSQMTSTNSAAVTVSAAGVTGSNNGIFVQNMGIGSTSVTATGMVEGASGDGIYATHTSVSNNSALTIQAAAVSGTENGIEVENNGTGSTSVTATGAVSAVQSDGIRITHYGTDVTVEATDVTANMTGVYVDNYGTGLTDITTAGTVTSAGFGIHVTNNAGNVGGIAIVAGNIDSSSTGIYTFNQGTGNTSITTNGTVTSTSSFGIRAHQMSANGLLGVTTNGVVEGSQGGVYLESTSPQAVTLTVNGGSEVRNISLNPVDLAIENVGNSGGIVNIVNNGTVTGIASLDEEDDTFNNNGVWNMAGGTSDFQSGTDILNNNGAFLAANATGLASTTVNNVEVVNHTGSIVLQNRDSRIGGASAFTGDLAIFSNSGSGDFQSNGGGLYVDTDFENAISDRLVVDNVSVTGAPTRVFVDPSSAVVPVTGEGIQVVQVLGTSDDDAFRMGNSVGVGLYKYEIGRGLNPQTEQSWYLRLSNTVRDEAIAANALSVLGSRTALATLSNLNERQRGGEVFSDEQTGRKGVWGRAFGQSSEFSSDGGTRAGYDATTWGAQAGMDLWASEGENGARKYAGVYLAHASSSGDALNGSSRIGKLDLDATSLGAYYTNYAASGWYADVVGQYSRLGGVRMRTSGGTQRPDGAGYALSLEGGRRFNRDGKVNTELQAQLIYQKTDLDDVTLADGNRLNIGSVNAVTGRLGVRLMKNPAYGGRLQPWVRANLWHTFNKDATVSSLGAKASTPFGGTTGEMQVGFALTPNQASGWSAYVAGGYLFDLSGSEYSGWKGTLGVRKGW